MASQDSNDDDDSIIVPIQHNQPQDPPVDQNPLQPQVPIPTDEVVVRPTESLATIQPDNGPPAAVQPSIPSPYDQPQPHMPEFMQPRPVDQQSAPQQPIVQPLPAVDPNSPYVYSDPNQESQLNQEVASYQRRKKFIKLLVILISSVIVIILLVICIRLVFKTNSGYVNQSFTNNGYTYSVLFDKHASHKTSNGKSYLTGSDYNDDNNIGVIAFLGSAGTCLQQNPALVHYFSLTIGRKSYPVCSDTASNAVFVNFQYNGAWQVAYVYSTNNVTPVSVQTAKTILGSLSIKG